MKSYYYINAAGKACGPLELETIRTAVNAGRLPEGGLLSENGGEPWKPMATAAELAARQQEYLMQQMRMDQASRLKSCSACGRQIANDAPACPHCGKRHATPVGLIFSVVIGLVIGIIFIIIPMCRSMGI